MSDTGSKRTQCRQFFAHYYLVLSALQVRKYTLQLPVLALQFLCELLNQVETLRLDGTTAKYFQGCCHVCDLVSPAHLHPRLQVAVGHSLHPVGKHLEATQ